MLLRKLLERDISLAKITGARSGIIRRSFASLVFTYAAIELASKITGILDSVMIARILGETDMAAFGLTSPYNNLMDIAIALLITGGQAMTVRAMVAGDRKKTDAIYSVAVEFAVAFSIVITAACLFFSPSVCELLGAKGNNAQLFQPLRGYTHGFAVGIPFLILFAVLSVFVTLDGHKGYVLAATVSLSAANLGLNYVFGEILGMGMFGFGLASSAARAVGVAVLLTDLLRKRCVFHFRFATMNPRDMRSLFGIGLAKLTRKAAGIAQIIIMNTTILATGGIAAMTAMSVRSAVIDFFFCLGIGVSNALLLMTQISYGEENKSAIRETFANALAWILCGAGLLSIAGYFLVPQITVLFGVNGDSHRTTVLALRVMAASVVTGSLNEMLFFQLQAMRKYRWAHVYVVFQRLSVIPAVLLLANLFGTDGIWWAFFASDVPIAVAYVVFALLLQRKERKKFVDAVLLIPKSFDDMERHTMKFSFGGGISPVGVSEKIQRFCLEQSVDERRAYCAALCAEEILCNIEKHGYARDSRPHHCECRVVAGEDLTLYFRDDCKLFDLRKRYEAVKDGDLESNMGIKLVCRICKDVIYSSTLGVNMLTLKL